MASDIDEGQSIEPRSYDGEGCACYDDDLLDLRWHALTDDAGPNRRLAVDEGVAALLYTDDVDLIRRGVEIIGQLAERHIRRLAHPGLLDEESGRAWHRQMRVDDLRSHPRYAELAERVGWPADPGDLNDRQMDIAILRVLMPHLLKGGEWERPVD